MLLTDIMEKKKDISNVHQTTNPQEKIEDRKNIINKFKSQYPFLKKLTKF